MNKKTLLPALFIGGCILFVMLSAYFYQMFYTPNVILDKEEAVIEIKPGTTAIQLAEAMKKDALLEDVMSFMFVAKVLDYQDNIKTGRFKLSGNLSNLEAVRILRSGKQEPVSVTFSIARRVTELPEKICKNLLADAAELELLITDNEFLKPYGFDTTTVACMFIPNTYQLYWDSDAKKVFERMNWEYKQYWNKDRLQKAEEIGLTPIQVSVLASIVQAETQKRDERDKVAGVYMNRLNRGTPLQADPTLVFAAGDFSIKRVLNKHKEIDSPYNTYKYTGLPPGPINIPEIASLDAVLNYEKHHFYFFCAKDDFSGYHAFAKTNAEHNRNAKRYWRALNRKRIYK